MKSIRKVSFLASLLAVAAVATVMAAELKTGTIDIPTDLTQVVNGTSNSTAGVAFTIPQNTDIIIMPTIQGASATTSNVVFGFNATPDGTNWTTVPPLTGTMVAQGATQITGAIYLWRTNLTGFKQIRFGYSSTTSLATVTNQGMRYGYFY